jgi:hypothetical protein
MGGFSQYQPLQSRMIADYQGRPELRKTRRPQLHPHSSGPWWTISFNSLLAMSLTGKLLQYEAVSAIKANPEESQPQKFVEA